MIGLIVWFFLVLFVTLVVRNYNYYLDCHRSWATESSMYRKTQEMKYDTFVKTYPLIKENLNISNIKYGNIWLDIPTAPNHFPRVESYRFLFNYIDWLRLRLFLRSSKKGNNDKYQHKEVYMYLQKVCQDELQKANEIVDNAYNEMKQHLEEMK